MFRTITTVLVAKAQFLSGLVLGLSAPPGDEPACDAAVTEPVVAELGPAPVRWAVALARQAMGEVLPNIPEERRMPLASRLAPAIENMVLELLLTLGGRARTFSLNAGEVAITAYLAGEGISYERIVEGLRIVRRVCTGALLDEAEALLPASRRAPVTRELTEVVNAFFDKTTDAITVEHLGQSRRLLARRLADQRGVIRSLLDGESVDAAAAGRVLEKDLTAHHLGLVAWLGKPASRAGARPEDARHLLEKGLHSAAVALHAADLLSVEADATTLWAWATSPRPLDAGALTMACVDGATGVRLAVGRSARGPAGFRRTHLAALDARRAALRSHPSEPVTRYDEVALISLSSTDSERAAWFVTEELGALAAPDRATADLRATLLAYLDRGSSLVRAAEALHVHRNTVVYRLRRAEELLGRTAAERTLETHLALRLAVAGHPS